MIFVRLLVPLAIILLVAPVTLASPHAEHTPTNVTMVATPEGALLAWTPGNVSADEYRVYTIHEKKLVLVVVTNRTFANLTDPTLAYGVTGVLDDVESRLVWTSSSTCKTYISYDPVDVSVRGCASPAIPQAASKVGVGNLVDELYATD